MVDREIKAVSSVLSMAIDRTISHEEAASGLLNDVKTGSFSTCLSLSSPHCLLPVSCSLEQALCSLLEQSPELRSVGWKSSLSPSQIPETPRSSTEGPLRELLRRSRKTQFPPLSEV